MTRTQSSRSLILQLRGAASPRVPPTARTVGHFGTMGLPDRPEEAHVLGYPGFNGSGLSTASRP